MTTFRRLAKIRRLTMSGWLHAIANLIESGGISTRDMHERGETREDSDGREYTAYPDGTEYYKDDEGYSVRKQ